MTDPKIVNHIRSNNEENAISHYNYTAPCDPGVGIVLPNNSFHQLEKIIISFDSKREHHNVALKPLRGNDDRFLVGKSPFSKNSASMVLHEKNGLLKVMIEHESSNKQE